MSERILGEHSAKIDALSDDITEIKSDVKKLLERENQREGSKKAVYTIATLLGTVGGALASKYIK